MATEIISTNLTATYFLDSNDDLFVAQGASVNVFGGHAIRTRPNIKTSHVDIYVLGDLQASGPASGPVSDGFGSCTILLGTAGKGLPTYNTVTIGPTGSLHTDSYGVGALGTATTVANLGTISAAIGIFVTGGHNRVENTGVITAFGTGIYLDGASGGTSKAFSTIHNAGTIQVAANPRGFPSSGLGMNVLESWARITNDGLIDAKLGIRSQASHTSVTNAGSILASAGPAIAFQADFGLLTNSGTLSNHGFQSAVDAQGAATDSGLSLTNQGRIESTGSVIFGTVKSVINDGTMVGGADGIHVTNSDTFRLINSGRIEGVGHGVFHSIGMKSVIQNTGTISGLGDPLNPGFAIFTDQVGGFVDNKGILLGDAHIDDGRLTNSGTIRGDVSIGVGEVVNSGAIKGNLLLLDSSTYLAIAAGTVTGNIHGSGGNDRLSGGSVADRILGNDGNDLVSGGGGDDVLTGGLGPDRLTGGAGADRFVYAAAGESVAGVGVDRITDFEAGVDRIDLTAFLSGAAFIGAAGFSGTGPEVRYDGATGVLRADMDGDRVVDFVVLITNHAAITAGDLIL